MIQIEGAAHQSSDPQFLDIIHHPLLHSYPPAPPMSQRAVCKINIQLRANVSPARHARW